ncbi:FliO/MopB family protein [Arthrobacter roseus]|uniref:FliO/MopB family protein n=1 Tax=Arthrobacter roseus TaxID=136274 RepID=UPI0019641F3F|nr:flagellar biosynthetic protein FliO [Arthrobacter roseus]MBM7847673.1 flagellar protein FliO/FliZ [Arthrobacter roseus]
MDAWILGLRVLLSLAAVVGLLWFIQKKVSRHNTSRPGAELISVVTRQAISTKASVVVLDTDGKRFMLGVTEQSVNILHTFDAEPESATAIAPAAPEAAGASFDQHLRRQQLATAQAVNTAPTATRASLHRGSSTNRGERALDGSILSPSTWKQTAAAFRRSTGE